MTEIQTLSDMIYKPTKIAETYKISPPHFVNESINPYIQPLKHIYTHINPGLYVLF